MTDTINNNEEEERVTAQSYGAMETTHAGAECWMIRLPQKLADTWGNATEGTDLGELVFTKGGSKMEGSQKINIKPGLTIHVAETLQEQVKQEQVAAAAAALEQADNMGSMGTSNSNSNAATAAAQAAATSSKPTAVASASSASTVLPLHYSLQAMTKKIPVMHPFTRNKNGTIVLGGIVTRTANAQVQQDSSYRALLKDRLVTTSINANRFVKPVEATESVMSRKSTTSNSAAAGGGGTAGGKANSNKKSFGNAILKYGKRLQEAAEGGADSQGLSKKARQFSPDQSLKSVIFELFSQQQYWTVKDLKAAAVAGGATHAGSKKGEAEMREVLREIGDYHRSGDHKNMWELRKEFQQQT